MFQKATRQQSKLRLCVSGPSGSGKTTGALVLAQAIKGDSRIAVIDTENGSASLYADRFDFDVLNMAPPFTPQSFVDAINGAERDDYSVIVIDSATHEWAGAGGCLAMNEQTARAKFKGNTWSAWSDTDKEHQKFIDAMVHSSKHIICTARSKTETGQEGKKIVRLGTKLVQRDNFEYEFTVALDLVHDGHFINVIKDRTGIFSGIGDSPISQETGEALLSWLNDGSSRREVVDSCIADIQGCESMQMLQDVFVSSKNTINQFRDMDLVNEIVEAKDKMKKKLTPSVVENEQPEMDQAS